jgi:hypothetical protein
MFVRLQTALLDSSGNFNSSAFWNLVQGLSAMQIQYQQIVRSLPQGECSTCSLRTRQPGIRSVCLALHMRTVCSQHRGLPACEASRKFQMRGL